MHITLDKLLELGWSEEDLRTLELIDIESTRGLNIWVRRVYETWDETFSDIGDFSRYRILKSKLPVCESCGGTGTLDTLWEKERSGLYFYDCPDCKGTGIGKPDTIDTANRRA